MQAKIDGIGKNRCADRRNDIQALRGFSILVVVLYHAHFPWVSSGYLGVDIFFVISGYLMTSLIVREVDDGTFSYTSFLGRRARRLLPSFLCVCAATAIVSPFLLSEIEFLEFKAQLAGALFFTANIVLWLQSGYFSAAAELKPLLHTWSLSIEEQYYFLVPLVITITRHRFRLFAFVVLTALSLLALFASTKFVSATFYLLPTRAWEMGIGSIAALANTRFTPNVPGYIRVMAALLLIASTATPILTQHPGLMAVVVCCCTATLLVCDSSKQFKHPSALPLLYLGRISYSLYLVHWPMFSLYHNTWVAQDHPPASIYALLIAAAFAISIALTKYIEEPIRKSNFTLTPEMFFAWVCVSVSILGLTHALGWSARSASLDWLEARKVNNGLNAKCEFDDSYRSLSECSGATPRVLVWGDSYAMHLVPGIVPLIGKDAIAQATKSLCAPFLNLAPLSLEKGYNEAWARRCISFNDSVISYAVSTRSISTVILASPFNQVLDGRTVITRSQEGEFSQGAGSSALALQYLRDVSSKLIAAGKKVILVAPPPNGKFDIGRCLERSDRDQLTFGAQEGCTIVYDEYLSRNEHLFNFLRDANNIKYIDVVNFTNALCNKGRCMTKEGGVPLYRDMGHLSLSGSVVAVGLTNLPSLLSP